MFCSKLTARQLSFIADYYSFPHETVTFTARRTISDIRKLLLPYLIRNIAITLPNNSDNIHVVIIGNGVTGSTVARHVRKHSNYRITMISSETEHFFSRTALMYVYMGHMRYKDIKPYEDWFWEKNRIDLVFDRVISINTQNKTLQLQQGQELGYDKLVLATGSSYNTFNWPGQDLKGVGGLYSWQDLEYMEAHTSGIKHAVVVGGGLIGIEMAEMLRSRNIGVTMLVREKSYWKNVLPAEESAMVNREIQRHHIDLRLNTELEEILGDEQGRMRAISTKDGQEIDCQFVGLTAGVHPNLNVVTDTDIETDRGILVNEYLETNIPDVYAAGDCAQFRQPFEGRGAVEQVWYTGKIQAEALALTICQKRTPYQPGVWFNSAKFFDIEYQVYGQVPAKEDSQLQSLYWEHPDGKKSIRIVYTDSGSVVGFNLMGVRYRQNICDRWIKEQTNIETVLQNLGAANFDPEFFRQYEQELVNLYNQQTGSKLILKRKRGLKNVLELLGIGKKERA